VTYMQGGKGRGGGGRKKRKRSSYTSLHLPRTDGLFMVLRRPMIEAKKKQKRRGGRGKRKKKEKKRRIRLSWLSPIIVEIGTGSDDTGMEERERKEEGKKKGERSIGTDFAFILHLSRWLAAA